MTAGSRTERHEFHDGSFVEYSFTEVPRSDSFPEGVKYGFQFVDPEGTPILRYDNAHGIHERHYGDGSGEQIEYEGTVEGQLRKFFEEVEELRARSD
jgi:hypothetical protein